MSTMNNTATNNNSAAEVTGFDALVQNGCIVVEPSNEIKTNASAIEYRKPNVMYQPVEAFNTETKKNCIDYEKVTLPPAKYQPHQTLESVVDDDQVIVRMTRTEYLSQYRGAEARSAREILTMCRIVYEASKTLDSAEYSDFCNDIGYKDGSSVIRKLTVIGKMQPRLIAYAEVLPASWTSIYSLTQIPAQIFENLIHMKQSFKELTVSQVNKLVKETRELKKIDQVIKPALVSAEEKNDKILGSTVVAKLYFTKLPDDFDWRAFEKALLEVEANLPVRVQFFSVLKEIFSERKNKRYEKIKPKVAPNPLKPQDWDMGREVSDMPKTALNEQSEKKIA